MSNTQGTFAYPIPDPLKSAIELAQNRLILLEGEEDRLKNLKNQLESEIRALSGVKMSALQSVKEAESQMAEKQLEISRLNQSIESLNYREAEASKYMHAAQAEAVTITAKTAELSKYQEALSVDIKGKEEKLSAINSEITEKKEKLEIFNRSVSNLL